MSEWQPIETAPRDSPVVVALIHDGRVWRVSDARFNRIGWYTVHGGRSCYWATHWMPLPDPPPPDRDPDHLNPAEENRCEITDS